MIRTPSKVILHAPHLARRPADGEAPLAVTRVIRRKIPAVTATWAELHIRALSHQGMDDMFWVLFFSARVGGNCECRKNWKTEIATLPPDFNNYFEWSVKIHNMVNERLGKPVVSVEEARSIWTPSEAQTPVEASIEAPEPTPAAVDKPPESNLAGCQTCGQRPDSRLLPILKPFSR